MIDEGGVGVLFFFIAEWQIHKYQTYMKLLHSESDL